MATMNNSALSRSQLARGLALRFVLAIVVLAVVLFLPAGTLNYWQAWVYIFLIIVPPACIMTYLLQHDPALLERRMRMREREPQQKWIMSLAYVWFFLVFLIPGFDVRFGWSNVPAPVVIAAELVICLGFTIILLVLRENSYASRVIEVAQDQPVISSGPYGVVRHPMYVGTGLMYLFTALALGSYWAVIPALFIIPVLVGRILNEERVLARDLPGYTAYMQKVRFRLIPGVW